MRSAVATCCTKSACHGRSSFDCRAQSVILPEVSRLVSSMPPRGKRSRKALDARNAKEPSVGKLSAEPQPTSAKRGKGRARGKAKENQTMEEQPKKRKLLEDEKQNGGEAPTAKRRRKRSTDSSTEETDTIILTSRPVVKLSEPMEVESVISHPSHSKIPGEVMVLGQGDMGQLGLGEDIMERKRPFPVGGVLAGKNVVQVVCGGMHTVALTDAGEVYTWGCNDEGALGRKIGEGEEYDPGMVDKLAHVKVVQVSAGDSHTAVLATNGNVYSWGMFRDSNGPFGLVKSSPSLSPELVYSTTFNKAVKIVSGSDHIIILTEQGDLFTFGCGEQGQLGRIPECFSTRGGRKGISVLLHPQVVRFRKLRGLPKPKFNDVFCGLYHTFGLTQDQGIYAWGLNNYGQLGTNDSQMRFQPERLPSDWIAKSAAPNLSKNQCLKQKLQIVGGQHHTLVCQNGSVFAIGRKEYGRLGLGENTEDPLLPKMIPGLQNIATIAAGTACSFAVSESGEAFAWGMGTNLQLGTGEEDDVWTPVKMSGKKIENRRVLSASAGGQHTALLVSRADAVE